MGNDIITGIIQKLRDTFGSETTIYVDEEKQELSEPCFFIRILTVSQDLVIRNRYRRVYSLDIEYRPEEREKIARELAEVADTLSMALEYISIGDNLTRGSGIHYEVQDGVLHFFIDYDFFVFKVLDREEYMETLIQTGHLKE